MANGLLGRQVLAVLAFVLHVHAAVSVDPVPPFQWLNLSPLLQGTTQPPGLKDAAMGYDETTRSLIIYGGEASSTVPQSQTYLLDLNLLVWSIPTPPATLQRTPPARSAAVSGIDTAASNRNGFIVIGGKGSDGGALSDVWEFDFTNEFWAEVNISPGGPSPRWGSSGGIDTRVPPVSDSVLPGPNNTFWLIGGQDGKSSFSDLWRLNVSGTLSSNLPNDSEGSWEQISLPDFPGKFGQGGGVIFQQIVTSGGCNDTVTSGDSCAVQNTYVTTSNRDKATAAPALNCPAPRLSPAVVPNANTFASGFASQMLVLLGTFNSSLWDDGSGLKDGEVAVLNVDTQSWTRVLPSGDPGTSGGTPAFPTPREGAAVVMSPQSLVGDSRKTSSDIIVFGGRDASGNYLSDLWLLRTYNGLVNSTHPKWSGFGNGQLQTGVNANGAGVTNKIVTSCASAIAPASPTGSTSNSTSGNAGSQGGDGGSQSGDGGSQGGSGGSPNDNIASALLLNTSLLHKLFAPLSIALMMPAFLLFRLTSPSFNSSYDVALRRTWYYVSGILGVVGYGLGIAGMAISFTTISSPDGKRPAPLSTTHGQAGLALFICFYGPLLLAAVLHASTKHAKPELVVEAEDSRKRADSDVTEKDQLSRSAQTPSPALSVRRRTQSWGPSSWRTVREDSLSIDSGSAEMADPFNSSPAQRGFEVLNRPARTRRSSGQPLAVPLVNISHPSGSHSLGDLDWLNRRRSLTAVGELEYHLDRSTVTAPPPSTPGTLLDPPVEAPSNMPSNMPPPTSVLSRLLFHVSLAALTVFCLVTLWSKAPRGAFAALLAWVAVFYIILIASSWRGRPDRSTLSLLFGRLRMDPRPRPTAPRPSVSDTLPETDENIAFPYTHYRPAYRRALLSDVVGPQSTDTEEEDDDRAEDEMRRRDISIVTSYPKRALRITNPS